MKIVLLNILFGIISTILFGQALPPDEYYNLIKKADSLYNVKEYKKSAIIFHNAFLIYGGKGFVKDRYNAARSWAKSKNKDSAFFNLERIITKTNYSNYDALLSESAFKSLHKDKRWEILLVQVKKNIEKLEANYNKPLIKLLDSLVEDDQKWRHKMKQYNNKELGNDTLLRKKLLQNLKTTDSLNNISLRKILNKFGFPNYDIAGIKGSNNFWLIIQHQDQDPEFQDSVLTMMKIEVDKRKASPIDYAYLLDRVKVNLGKLQIYGTQMELNENKTSYKPKPVIEPEKLNERRKNIGLNTIEDSIDTMNKNYYGTLNK